MKKKIRRRQKKFFSSREPFLESTYLRTQAFSRKTQEGENKKTTFLKKLEKMIFFTTGREQSGRFTKKETKIENEKKKKGKTKKQKKKGSLPETKFKKKEEIFFKRKRNER